MRARAPRGLRPLALGVVLGPAAALGPVACAEPGAGARTAGEGPEPTSAVQRRFEPVEWKTVFRVGGALEDTLLLRPGRIAADGRGVVLADLHGGRVLRFDSAGHLSWSFGRKGAGPDELAHPRDLKLDARGRTWILDVENGRLVVLDTLGRPARRIRLQAAGGQPDDFAPLRGGEVLLLVGDARRPVVRLGTSGELRARQPFPDLGFAELDPMASQLVVASHPGSGGWAAVFQLGDGLFLFGADGKPVAAGRFVEPVPFPEVVRRRSGGALGREETLTHLAEPVFAAWSITLSPQQLYVLFIGRTEHRGRLLDAYDLRDASYRGTYLLPRTVDQVAWGDGLLYATYHDPYPTLIAWRPVGGALP